MKKMLFTAFTAGFLVSLASAQVGFGLKAGLNLAKIKTYHQDSGDPNESTDTRTGFNAGGFVHVPLTSRFSLQPELVYSQEGGKDKDTHLELQFSYLNLPVMLQYNASGFVVETGPQLSFLMQGKATLGSLSEDLKENMKSTAFSWALGAGYRLVNGFGLNARYNLGLSHIMKGDTKEGSVRNNVIQFDLSYLIGGRK